MNRFDLFFFSLYFLLLNFKIKLCFEETRSAESHGVAQDLFCGLEKNHENF